MEPLYEQSAAQDLTTEMARVDAEPQVAHLPMERLFVHGSASSASSSTSSSSPIATSATSSSKESDAATKNNESETDSDGRYPFRPTPAREERLRRRLTRMDTPPYGYAHEFSSSLPQVSTSSGSEYLCTEAQFWPYPKPKRSAPAKTTESSGLPRNESRKPHQPNAPGAQQSSQHTAKEPNTLPALIPCRKTSKFSPSRPVSHTEGMMPMTVPQIYEMARGTTKPNKFHMCLTPPQCKEERMMLSEDGCEVVDYMASTIWHGNVWGNFLGQHVENERDVSECVDKALKKFVAEEIEGAVFLTSICFERGWFMRLMQFPYCFLTKGVRSPLQDTMPAQADAAQCCSFQETVDRECAVFYLGHDKERFTERFQECSVVPGLNSWAPRLF